VWLRFVLGLEKGHDVDGGSRANLVVVGPGMGHWRDFTFIDINGVELYIPVWKGPVD